MKLTGASSLACLANPATLSRKQAYRLTHDLLYVPTSGTLGSLPDAALERLVTSLDVLALAARRARDPDLGRSCSGCLDRLSQPHAHLHGAPAGPRGALPATGRGRARPPPPRGLLRRGTVGNRRPHHARRAVALPDRGRPPSRPRPRGSRRGCGTPGCVVCGPWRTVPVGRWARGSRHETHRRSDQAAGRPTGDRPARPARSPRRQLSPAGRRPGVVRSRSSRGLLPAGALAQLGSLARGLHGAERRRRLPVRSRGRGLRRGSAPWCRAPAGPPAPGRHRARWRRRPWSPGHRRRPWPGWVSWVRPSTRSSGWRVSLARWR